MRKFQLRVLAAIRLDLHSSAPNMRNSPGALEARSAQTQQRPRSWPPKLPKGCFLRRDSAQMPDPPRIA
eukprot:12697307-Alexandrium_andersonii.AAC.1